MYINVIDKIFSEIIDNFFLKKIKNNTIKKEDSILNIITNFINNNLNKNLKKFNINISDIQNINKLNNIIILYLYYYYNLYIFLNKITTITNDMNICKQYFINKYNKENKYYFNSITNNEIINYISIGLDIIYTIKIGRAHV